MPSDEWYVLTDELWRADHMSGRYHDLIGKINKFWCHRKPNDQEFTCPEIAEETSSETSSETSNETSTGRKRLHNPNGNMQLRRSARGKKRPR